MRATSTNIYKHLIEQLEELLRAANLEAMPESEPEPRDGTVETAIPSQNQNLGLFGIGNMGSLPLPPQQEPYFGQVPLIDPDIQVPGLPHSSTSQLVGLGLFEQLPSYDVIDEL